MKAKERADIEFGIDLDKRALEMSNLDKLDIKLIHDDGIRFLESFPFGGHEVVYCDPPYHPSTRKRDRVYQYDFSEDEHDRFLELVTRLNAKIIISGYDNKTYRQRLCDWHLHTYTAKAHDAVREECLWHNFPRPSQLHDYRYLGSNYRERQTIRRRLDRIQRRLERLTGQERSFLMRWLNSKEDFNAD